MGKYKIVRLATTLLALVGPFIIAHPAFATSSNVAPIEDFIRNIIKAVTGLAGLVATGFFVVGGFTYITSSGNPNRLDRAKQTLVWSGVGLAIVIAAFAVSNIITGLAISAFGS